MRDIEIWIYDSLPSFSNNKILKIFILIAELHLHVKILIYLLTDRSGKNPTVIIYEQILII